MSRLKVGDASGDNCISCGSSISADNKSPVPLCCFPCYEDQSRIEEALEESEPQVLDSEVAEEFCPETPSKTSSHGEVPSEKVVEAAPESGWMRKKREGYGQWFARIRAFQEGPEACQSQAHYLHRWKSMSMEEQQGFQAEMAAKDSDHVGAAVVKTEPRTAFDEVPWLRDDDGFRRLVLPPDYTVSQLEKDFAEYQPLKHSQKGWEMYGLLLFLMEMPSCPIRNPAQACEQLKILKVNKHILYRIRKDFGNSLPFDCPPVFQAGRTPQSSLNEREKEDVFLFLKFHERTGTALTIQQCEDAIIIMKLAKEGRLDDKPTQSQLQERLESERPKRHHLWRDFKTWVEENKSPEEHLCLSRLKVKSVHELTSCTPKVVGSAHDALQALLTEHGFLEDGILKAESAGRILCCDEKGFSSRPSHARQRC